MFDKNIKSLTNQCANLFDGGECVWKEKHCTVRDNKPCGYFGTSVLPIDEGLLALYHKTVEAESHGDTLSRTKKQDILKEHNTTRKCERCKKEFQPSNNRQKYCENCKKILNREQSKARKQNQRESECPVTL